MNGFEILFNNFFHDQSNETEYDRYYRDNFYYGTEDFKKDENYYRASNFYNDNNF